MEKNHHHHHHSHDESASRIGMAFILNVGFTFIEFIGGWLTNSTAIMADAVHDFKKGMNEGNAEIDAAKKAKEADAIEHEKKDV